MKKIFLLLTIATLFVACGSNSKRSIEYVQQTSSDKTYKVEVPASAGRQKCIESLMSFVNDKNHLFITINKEDLSPREFDETQQQDPSFTRTVIEDNDSIFITESTRGTMNAWAAYNCIGQKNIDGTNFIITVACDTWGMDECKEVLLHMMNSIDIIE